MRVEVDAALPPARLPGPVVNEVCAHALESLPEECCGLVTGGGRWRHARVFRCRNEMTRLHGEDPVAHPRDGRTAFWMNERDYARARDQAEALGETVTAIYHSHVDYGAYLSELDVQWAERPLFPFPRADHLVVSVCEGRVRELALFERDAGRGGFRGRLVKPEAW